MFIHAGSVNPVFGGSSGGAFFGSMSVASSRACGYGVLIRSFWVLFLCCYYRFQSCSIQLLCPCLKFFMSYDKVLIVGSSTSRVSHC